MKKEYTKPTVVVVELESEDIIRTSGATGNFNGFGAADEIVKW